MKDKEARKAIGDFDRDIENLQERLDNVAYRIEMRINGLQSVIDKHIRKPTPQASALPVPEVFVEDCPFCGHETPFKEWKEMGTSTMFVTFSDGVTTWPPRILQCLVCGKKFQKKEKLEEVK